MIWHYYLLYIYYIGNIYIACAHISTFQSNRFVLENTAEVKVRASLRETHLPAIAMLALLDTHAKKVLRNFTFTYAPQMEIITRY